MSFAYKALIVVQALLGIFMVGLILLQLRLKVKGWVVLVIQLLYFLASVVQKPGWIDLLG